MFWNNLFLHQQVMFIIMMVFIIVTPIIYFIWHRRYIKKINKIFKKDKEENI